MSDRTKLGAAKRVVVKVGSSSLARREGGLDEARFADLATQIAALRGEGREIILVSSGAIAAGRALLGLTRKPRTMPLKQACAATGQRELMDRWEAVFRPHGIRTAQVLLTGDDVRSRPRFVNARNTFEALLRFGVLPVVNENDTVAVEEIRLGDNDHLSVLVTNLVRADLLVLLTDTDGLFTADPNRDPAARRIPFVASVDDQVLGLAGESGSDLGRGGMRSKVTTAGEAATFGVSTVIARGGEPDILRRALRGEDVGTLFAAAGDPIGARKHWIAYSVPPRGTLVLDEGAVTALRENGRSLLPSGVVAVEGDFGAGDAVSCRGPAGAEVARGLTNYSATVLRRIRGMRTDAIRAELGDDAFEEAIHRDDLVLV